jgi:hypothetical protein
VNAVKARTIYVAALATLWLGLIAPLRGMSDGNGI